MNELYKILFRLEVLILSLLSNVQNIYSQCPTFTTSSMTTDCFASGPDCILCLGEIITLKASGTNLPEGQCVKWYYSGTSGFNPYNGEGIPIDCGDISSGAVSDVTIETFDLMCDQDIYIVGIVIPLSSTCSEVFTNEFKIHVSCPEAVITVNDTVCSGKNIQFYGTGGGTYSWLGPNGFSSNQQNPLHIYDPSVPPQAQDGEYILIVTDMYGCADLDLKVIETTLPSGLLIFDPPQVGLTVLMCGPGPITFIDVTPWSNHEWHFYGWSVYPNSQTIISNNPTIFITDPGIYGGWVESDNGCIEAQYFFVEFTGLNVSITPPVVYLCPGSSTEVTAEADNGVGPYTYLWSTGETTQSIVISEVGQFWVTVTDSEGCTGTSYVFGIETPPIDITISGNNIGCVGSDNFITATGSNGTTPYTYEWETPVGPLSGNTINANIAGDYVVNVTDANGCTATKSISISISEVQVSISPSSAIICNGGTVPLIANASGGSGTGYTYNWATPSGSVNGKIVNANMTGTYAVTVTDSKGCSDTSNINVSASNQLLVTINPNPALFCKGGSVILSVIVNGGSPGYNYKWSTTQGSYSSESVIAKTQGSYNVTVTDLNGCSGSVSINVGVKPDIIVTITSDKKAICDGQSLTLSANSPDPDIIEYKWSTPDGVFFGDMITASKIGDYSLTVTSFDGCTGVAVYTVNKSLPPDLSITAQSGVLCLGKSIEIIANSTDTNIVSYNWITPTGIQTGNSIKVDSSGIYIVTITNDVGCSSIDSVNIIQSPEVQVSASPDSTLVCVGGNVLLTASSTTEPLTYEWVFKNDTIISNTLQADIPGLYIVNGINEFGCAASDSVSILQGAEIDVSIQPQDPTICLGSTIKLTATGISNSLLTYNWTTPIGAKTGAEVIAKDLGVYTVIVNDPYGCEGKDSVEVKEGMPLLVITPANPGFCKGQGVEISALVAGLNLTYYWSTPKGTFNTAKVFADVVGTYTVTVTDEGGCSGTTSAEVILYPDLSVVIDPNPASFCGAGSAKLTAYSNNGQSPFTYVWNTPAGIGSNNIFNANVVGTYKVEITDSLGCTGTTEAEVTKSNTLLIGLSDPGFCPGSSVDISVSPNGGQEPYNYSWQTPIGNFNNEIVNTSTAGSYLVTVTDVNGCTGEGQLEVKEYSVPDIQIDPEYGFCTGKNVEIIPVITDPLLPITYTWVTPTGNYTTPEVTAEDPGLYTITVTNNKGCSQSSSTNVDEWEIPEIAIDPNPVSFCKGVGVAVKAIITKAKTPYSYEWTGPSINSNANIITVTNAGSYNLSITDANGCGSNANFTVSEEPGLNVAITTDPEIKCNVSNYNIIPQVTGGNGNYQYSWQTPDGPKSGININTSAYGQFSITVTDTKGCTGTSSLVVNNDKLQIEIVKTDPGCLGPNTGELEIVSATNAVYPLSLIINNKPQKPINALPYKLQKLQADNYEIELTATNGCKYTESLILNTHTSPELELGPDVTIYLGESYVIIPQANFTIDSIHWNDTTYLVCEPGCLEPISTPGINIEYKATAYSKDGCVAKDNLRIYVVEKQSVYVPNSFSPNGDGINDEWVVLTDNTVVKVNKMYIYDRWGESILMQENFPANDPDFGWNGKFRNRLMNPGVFVYYFIVEFKDGRTKEFKGDINLVR